MIQNVDVVILLYNRSDCIQETILPLIASSSVSRIIVVDNGSTDGSREKLELFASLNPRITPIFLSQNFGIAVGRNAGFAMTTSEIVVSIDDDSYFNPDSIAKIRTYFTSIHDLGVLAFSVFHKATGAAQNYAGSEDCEVANHHGAGCAFRGSVLRAIGGIDPKCTFGAEELDLCIRFRDLGYKTLYTPCVLILHDNKTVNTVSKLNFNRRTLRVYNFTRVACRYFSVPFSLLCGFRYAMRQFISSIRLYGIWRSFFLLFNFLAGVYDGIRTRARISPSAEKFYRQPSLKPDFGNKPLWSSVLSVIRKHFS